LEHYWTMTDRGLLCADCEESADLLNKLEDDDDDQSYKDSRDDVKKPSGDVRIEDGLIIIEEAQANLFQQSSDSINDTKLRLAILITPNKTYSLI
jgi:hypothetical protein